MGLRMATPWKHEPSGVYYFRQRVPTDLVAVVGRRLEKHSLRTKNEREAIGKFRKMAAEHQARWDQMRKGRQSLSHKQCVALSKEIYDDFLVQRETGEPIRGFIGLPLFLGACEEARNIEIGSKAERLQKLEGLHGERVREMLSRADDAAIVRATIGLAHELGIEVVAEGVETAAQRGFLIAAGCKVAQGYFFGKPVPAAETGELLRRNLQFATV
jgi:hypothetical protein